MASSGSRTMLVRAVTRVSPVFSSRASARNARGRSVVAPTFASNASSSSSETQNNDDPEPGKGSVTVTFRGRTTTLPKGTKLRSSLLRANETPHNGNARVVNCRGLGTCGTCAVEIVPPDAVFPNRWNSVERARLHFPPHKAPGNAKLRLACQVQVQQTCEIRKYDKFWGQGDFLLNTETDDNVTPFGEWEFALDSLGKPKEEEKPRGRV